MADEIEELERRVKKLRLEREEQQLRAQVDRDARMKSAAEAAQGAVATAHAISRSAQGVVTKAGEHVASMVASLIVIILWSVSVAGAVLLGLATADASGVGGGIEYRLGYYTSWAAGTFFVTAFFVWLIRKRR